MSWIDRIQNDLIIRMANGRSFYPKWKNCTVEKEFNVSRFEFVNKSGTLVKRSKPKGKIYEFEFFFDGEDHLDEAEDFMDMSDDERAWTMIHPYYGTQIVQPDKLKLDQTQLNCSVFTGTMMETITEDNPQTSFDPKDKIQSDKGKLNAVAATVFVDNVHPDTTDITKLSATNEDLYKIGAKQVKLTVDAQDYFNAFAKAQTAIFNATAEPLAAINEMQFALNMPALFQSAVQDRLSMLVSQFNQLRLGIGNIITPSKKRIYENNGSMLISSMAVAAGNPQDNDYRNKSDVQQVSITVLSNYSLFIDDLDAMQTDNGGDENSYIPDYDSMNALDGLVNYAVVNLTNIGLTAKQERTIILEDDSNAILLTHRFYGIDENDSNLQYFMDSNNLGLKDYLGIRKNTPVVYYV